MDFTFNYTVIGNVFPIVVTVADEIIAEAQKLGVDVPAIESEVKTAVDGFVNKITAPSFWSKIESVVDEVANLEGGKRRRSSKKLPRKVAKKLTGAVATLEGGKRRRSSKKTSKKGSKKMNEDGMTGGKRRNHSRKLPRKVPKN